MRRLADELGIQAPSLYKHFPDKQSITTAVHIDYLAGQVRVLEAALDDETDQHPLVRVTHAYRDYCCGNDQLYRYLFLLPYPTTAAAPTLKRLRVLWMKAAGDSDLAIAAYALARGMVDMELHSLYPIKGSPGGAYDEGLAGLVQRAEVLAGNRLAAR
jgi:AcrR family transcriptional regulator